MSAPVAPKSNRRLLVVGILAGVVIVTLLIPPILAGGFTVPVSKVTFGETTGSLTATSPQVSVQTMTAYEYEFSVRTGGLVRTIDNDVSSSRGTANVTMQMRLINPSGQTIDLGKVNISGAIGTRTHTIYLSVDQGVRVPGSYELDILINVNVAPVGGLLQLNLSVTMGVNFRIS